MKIIALILSAIFALFAIVQFNDPDPEVWVVWYGAIAVAAALTAFGKMNKLGLLAGIIGGAVALIFYIPDFIAWIQGGMESITGSMKAETPFVELVREFLGLLLGVLALTYLYFQVRRSGTR